MIINDIPKSEAILYKVRLSEIRPDWNVKIISEDYNLYKLGFAKDIPCSLSIDASYEQIEELYDDIMYMEICWFNHEAGLGESMTTEQRKELKKLEDRYNKYAPLTAIYDYWMD